MTDTALRTVLLTRPAHRNQRLAQGLQREGITTISLPALQVVPLIEQVPEDYTPGHFDLVVFVSGVAAECYLRPLFQQEGGSWPSSTKIGTVGVSTRAAAQKLIHQVQDNAAELQWRHPPALQPNHDSEQLWAILQPKLDSIKKVLIVRGLSGRDWLKDQFLQANIDVPLLRCTTANPIDGQHKSLHYCATRPTRSLSSWSAVARAPRLFIPIWRNNICLICGKGQFL